MKYDIKVDISAGTSHTLILNRIKRNTKVLEFGPASGYMTQYMRDQLGCKVTCVEIDEQAAALAEKYAERMIVADIDRMDWYVELKDESFDHIIFADVLEHLRKPADILRTASSLLNEEGSIALSVPNVTHNAIIMEMLQDRFDYRSEGLLDETHIHFFTRKHVLEVLESAGLMPIEWLVTQRRPETTEFKQDYRNFPSDIRKYLKARPDGHVYQFVVISQKSQATLNNENVFDNNHNNYLDASYLQVYWGFEGLFSEGRSVRTPIKIGGEEYVTYRLSLPNQSNGKIRIDVSETITTGEISKIEIYKGNDEDKVMSYIWDGSVGTSVPFEAHDMILFRNTNSVGFVGLSEDPHILLRDYELLVEETETVFIEITMQIDNNAAKALMFLYHSLVEERIRHSDMYNALQTERNLLDLKLQGCNEKFKELSDLNEIQTSQLKEVVADIEVERAQLILMNAELSENSRNYKELYEIARSDASAQNQIAVKVNEIAANLSRPSLLKRIWRRLTRKHM